MKKSDDKRIVITGIGLLTPIGIGNDTFWQNALAGTCGISKLYLQEGNEATSFFGGEIKDFNPKEFVAQRKSLKVMSRDMQTVTGAAKLACEQAGIAEGTVDPTRFGVSIGAGMIHADVNELSVPISASRDGSGFSLKKFGKEGMARLFPLWLLKQLPNMLAAHLSIFHNAQGPSNSLTTGSSAGLQAVGEASRIIERDDADFMLCGGADSRTHSLDLIKYNSLDLLYKGNGSVADVYCPYDKRRSGFVPGEAAAIVVIERLSAAKKRGAPIYAEIMGYGSSAGVTIYQTDIDKRAMVESLAIKAALADAGLSPENIDCVIGHGYSSVIDDAAETLAYKKALGNRAGQIPVTSPSSMIGYVGSATGCVNLATAVFAIRDNKVSPTIFLKEPDPQCDLDYVPGTSRDLTVHTALVNTFDFSGQGAAMVVRKFEA